MEKDSGAADTDLLEGYAAYEEFSRARQITLSSVAIEEAIVSGGVGRVLMALKADDSLTELPPKFRLPGEQVG